jgi:hypothetical protein
MWLVAKRAGPSLAVVVRLKSLVRQPCRHPALGARRPFIDEGDCRAPFMPDEPLELRLRAGVENELKARFRTLGEVSLAIGALSFGIGERHDALRAGGESGKDGRVSGARL